MRPGRPSATAQVVAAALVCLEHDRDRAALLPRDPAAWRDAVLGGSGASRALRASARRPVTRWAWRALADALLPDVMAHYATRKARIEQHVRSLIDAGATRVCLVGAGLDTLALRLAPSTPHVEWVELDHPATQDLKLAGLQGRAIPDNIRFRAVDLARGRTVLPTAGRRTVFVAEGVLMYLSADRVDALLRAGGPAAPGGSHWILTYMRAGADGRGRFEPASGLVDRWLRLRGEPFDWALDPDAADAWAAARGLEPVAHEESPFDVPAGVRPSSLRGENLLVLRDAATG